MFLVRRKRLSTLAAAAAVLALGALAAVPATAAAPGAVKRACLIEGRMMGETIKDCSEATMPGSAEDYASQCRENVSAFTQMGGSATATVLPACPAKAQAACVGIMGQPASAYYYARDAASLAAAQKGCVAQRGKWVANP
ncbi:hypothetical protein [Caulobacter mirabilis]|uniref:Uncharacterized protein n=1 Tax=Caulobacter mirabilis TaxID=69666 RepID=A0A2D2AV22_9CAUL|nr:hypothetical protein [Caulobacter mirabilis]ATQ41835.1 hypothetical protein CSW64_05115 [Caulobacter mirabilis]